LNFFFFGLSLIIAVAVGFVCGKKQKSVSPPPPRRPIDNTSTADDESSADEDYHQEYNNSKNIRANYNSYTNKAMDDYDERQDNYGKTRSDVSMYAPYEQQKKSKKQKQSRKEMSRDRSYKENRRISAYDSSPYNPGVMSVKPERPTNTYYDVDNMYSNSDKYQNPKKQKKQRQTEARDSYIEMDDVYQDQSARRPTQSKGYTRQGGYYYE